MKKTLILTLVIALILAFTACGGKKNDMNDAIGSEQEIEETVNGSEDKTSEEDKKIETENKNEEPDQKPEQKPESKPEQKPVTTPTEKPEQKPEETPSSKPEESPKTVGQTLLADFQAKASSNSDVNALAEAILSNPVIAFSGATMPVEPGLLSGFGNTEIKGFKNGAMFGPVIGSVPFIGYIFELEDGTNVSEFISTLKSNADLRWNICVEADEMVTGSKDNKVFFVMCPKSFEE